MFYRGIPKKIIIFKRIFEDNLIFFVQKTKVGTELRSI